MAGRPQRVNADQEQKVRSGFCLSYFQTENVPGDQSRGIVIPRWRMYFPARSA